MSGKDPSIPLVKNEVSEENYTNLHVDESMQIVKVEPKYEKEITLCLMEQDLLFNADISNLPVRKKEIVKNGYQCMNNLQSSHNTIRFARSNTLTYSDDRTHAQDFFTHRITLPNNEQKSVKHNSEYYQCELCNFKTTRQTSVVSHLREQHDFVIFECRRCDYVTWWRHCLTRHVLFHHGHPRFKCPLCNFVSKWKYHLIEHLNTHSRSNIKLLHSSSTNQTRLAENMKQCYSSTGFNCTHCDYVTKFKKRLIFHMKSCHDSVE